MSTTHSIVGAIVGFAIAGIGISAVNWGQVGSIVLSWIVSPVLAGAIAFVLFASVRRLILLIGAVGIVAGLAIFGHKVMATVGSGITALTPSHGFAVELGAASTVVLASSIGLPISTTHTLVGAVLGVGMARGIAAINLRIVRTIFVSWIVTLPAGAFLAVVFYYVLKTLLA